MILPSKHISTSKSLLGLGGRLLVNLNYPKTVSDLWDELRTDPDFGNYQQFVLALDFLYLIGCVKLDKGRLMRCVL